MDLIEYTNNMGLIKITDSNKGEKTVSARDLYSFLGATERFSNWMDRQLQYGFEENIDYLGCKVFNALANQEVIDYALTLDCAKEISMLARNERGKQARRYFIECEKTLRRGNFQVPTSFREALLLAADLQGKVEDQQKQITQKDNQIAVLEKESEYTRVILQNKGTTLVTQIAQDYGMSAMKLNAKLRDFGIQHKVRRQWILYGKYLNKGYVHSSSTPIVHKDGREDISLTTEWTQRGRLFLYNILKSNGILPLIEI